MTRPRNLRVSKSVSCRSVWQGVGNPILKISDRQLLLRESL